MAYCFSRPPKGEGGRVPAVLRPAGRGARGGVPPWHIAHPYRDFRTAHRYERPDQPLGPGVGWAPPGPAPGRLVTEKRGRIFWAAKNVGGFSGPRKMWAAGGRKISVERRRPPQPRPASRPAPRTVARITARIAPPTSTTNPTHPLSHQPQSPVGAAHQPCPKLAPPAGQNKAPHRETGRGFADSG